MIYIGKKLNADQIITGGDGETASKQKKQQSPVIALKNRGFLLLWLGMFASYNAMQMQVVANGWLVYSKTGSPLALGLVSAGWGVLPAGVLAEAFGAPFTVMLGGSLLTIFVIALALMQPNLKKLS